MFNLASLAAMVVMHFADKQMRIETRFVRGDIPSETSEPIKKNDYDSKA